MKQTELFYLIVYPIVSMVMLSCGGKKYIQEIPYRYSTDKLIDQKEKGTPKYSNVYDTPKELNDEVLKIKEKYSIIMGVMPKELTDYRLYSFIDEWIGAPYKKQTLDKNMGVDASYFVQALFSDVYEETFPKTPDGIFRSKSLQLFTGRIFLKEGDILFFRYDKFHPISDVGIYLRNDRILACTAEGLNIYDFKDEYFQLRYVAAGRLKEKNK